MLYTNPSVESKAFIKLLTQSRHNGHMTESKILYDNWQLDTVIPAVATFFFEEALSGTALATMNSELPDDPRQSRFSAIFPQRPDMSGLDALWSRASEAAGIDEPPFAIGPLPERNWLKENLLSFPPLKVGVFYIYGSHVKRPKVPRDYIPLKINAATAFGSGEHQTTRGCLEALSCLKRKPKTVLDMGCGSGILSIAAASRFGATVLAVDIDPEAARVAAESANRNGVTDMVTAQSGNGYRTKGVRKGAPYDLILSNILARPLVKMAPSLAKVLSPKGTAILSGFLERDTEWVIARHTREGLRCEKLYAFDGWITAVLRK